MQGDGSAATVMLGLDGFVLLAVSEYAGELEQAIETTAAEVFCRGCGVQARLHDRRPSWVRDLPSGGRPVTLVWVKRVWRCMERSCPTSTWTETSQNIRARACLTERARREICRRVGEEGHSVAEVARDFGVGWGTAMAAVAAGSTAAYVQLVAGVLVCLQALQQPTPATVGVDSSAEHTANSSDPAAVRLQRAGDKATVEVGVGVLYKYPVLVGKLREEPCEDMIKRARLQIWTVRKDDDLLAGRTGDRLDAIARIIDYDDDAIRPAGLRMQRGDCQRQLFDLVAGRYERHDMVDRSARPRRRGSYDVIPGRRTEPTEYVGLAGIGGAHKVSLQQKPDPEPVVSAESTAAGLWTAYRVKDVATEMHRNDSPVTHGLLSRDP